MFRKKKDKNSNDNNDLIAPNINDDDDAMWFNPTAMSTAPTMELPGMGIPPPAPPNGIRMSISPTITTSKKSPTTSTGRKRYAVDDIVAAINFNDWGTVMKILDQDPKVASKNAQLNLKGQRTEGNPLLNLVIVDPPVEVVEKMIKAYPSGASNTDRQGDRTALHWACIANANPAVLEVVANANTAACRHQDKKFARTPLHYLALIAEDPHQIHLLMDVERRAAAVKDLNGQTPLDLANDSSNTAKMEIVGALQRKRQSTIFGAFNKSQGKYKSRTASPGKYASRESITAPLLTEPPSGSSGRPERSRSTRGEPTGSRSTSHRESSGRSKSPGKHRDRHRDSHRDREKSSRSKRSTDGEKESRRSHRESSSRKERSSSKIEASDTSDVEASGEFAPQPMSTTSFSAAPSRSVSPVPSSSRSRSPMPHRSSQPLVPQDEPPIVHGSPIAMTSSPVRLSTASRPSSQVIAAGMDGEMQALRDKLERKKRAVETKDKEIQQMEDQIEDNKEEIAALYQRAQGGGAAAPVDNRRLSEKRDKVQRLKDKIAELQAELKQAEKDVKRMERDNGGTMDMASIQDQILSKEDERSSLQFVKDALVQERMAAQRDVENAESELKSLETIQMMAQADSLG